MDDWRVTPAPNNILTVRLPRLPLRDHKLTPHARQDASLDRQKAAMAMMCVPHPALQYLH